MKRCCAVFLLSKPNNLLIGICLLFALMGCKKDDIIPTATTPSTSTGSTGTSQAATFAASEWAFFLSTPDQANPNQTESSLTTDGAVSTSPTNLTLTNVYAYSLGIQTPIIKNPDVFSYWSAPLTPPKGLLVGKSLTLTAKVQLQNVQGAGVSLALRGDRKTQSGVLFVSTQGKVSLSGTHDFTAYSVTLPYTASVDYFAVYLVFMPQTTGKAVFKEVSVQVN